MPEPFDLKPEAYRIIDGLFDATNADEVARYREQLRLIMELAQARKAGLAPASIGAPDVEGAAAARPVADFDTLMARMTDMLGRMYEQIADRMAERLAPALAAPPALAERNGGGTDDANPVEPAHARTVERSA